MKRRNVFALLMVVALLMTTGASVLAQPAEPARPQPQRGAKMPVGVAWGAILDGHAGAHNFVRRPTEELPVFTVLPGTDVGLVAGASGVWLGEAGGTLSADLEVYARDNQGNERLLGEDHASATKEEPGFEREMLQVPLTFDQPGEVHLRIRLTSTAEPNEGASVQDRDVLEAQVTVLDPSAFGSISGQVTADDTGEGLEGVLVAAGNPEMRIHRTARTDADGNYHIEDLPPAEYIVGVQAKGTAYVGELYDDAHAPDEATPVAVTESAETAGISFGLARGAEVSGQVVDEETGEPLAGIAIVVHPRRSPEDAGRAGVKPPSGEPAFALQGPPALRQGDRPGPRPDHPRHQPRPAAITDEDGTYLVQGLPAGEYTVAAMGVRQGYGVEFWEEAPAPGEATPLAVELGQSVSDINFTLTPR